jgi:hypothetical protein
MPLDSRSFDRASVATVALACASIFATGAAAARADSTPSVHQSQTHAQIQLLAERFRAAIVAKDGKTLCSLFIPGNFWAQVFGDQVYAGVRAQSPTTPQIVPGNCQQFADYIVAGKERFEEQFSNLRINGDDTVASLYFDYTFLIDNKVSNSGVETWQLIHTPEGWKINALIYSVASVTPPAKNQGGSQ